jgi:putative ABC transport system permease protein
MKIFKLIFKNAGRHKLRTTLTMLGIAVALLAFGLIRTVISAWYAGVEASAQNRLVTRSAVSLIQPLPLAYREQLLKVSGVKAVGYANWFGAYYGDPNNFFANFAIDEAYLDMYPEFVVPPEQRAAYLKERNACIVGRKLAERFGWKLDQAVTLTGTIFFGDWEFVIRGIYTGGQPSTDETQFFFHWEYLNERIRERSPVQADNVGWYMLLIDNQANPAAVSDVVDAMFKNSYAETKTETERAFQQSFVSMSGAILLAMESISGVVIFIVLLVLANTMAMTARERLAEYAVMKTLGFRPFHLVGLIGGESLLIAMGGFAIGLALMVYVCNGFATFITANLGNFFPVFELKNITVILAFLAALLVGLFAAVFPAWRAVQMRIADALHRVG